MTNLETKEDRATTEGFTIEDVELSSIGPSKSLKETPESRKSQPASPKVSTGPLLRYRPPPSPSPTRSRPAKRLKPAPTLNERRLGAPLGLEIPPVGGSEARLAAGVLGEWFVDAMDTQRRRGRYWNQDLPAYAAPGRGEPTAAQRAEQRARERAHYINEMQHSPLGIDHLHYQTRHAGEPGDYGMDWECECADRDPPVGPLPESLKSINVHSLGGNMPLPGSDTSSSGGEGGGRGGKEQLEWYDPDRCLSDGRERDNGTFESAPDGARWLDQLPDRRETYSRRRTDSPLKTAESSESFVSTASGDLQLPAFEMPTLPGAEELGEPVGPAIYENQSHGASLVTIAVGETAEEEKKPGLWAQLWDAIRQCVRHSRNSQPVRDDESLVVNYSGAGV